MRTEKEYNGILFDQLEILERIEEIAENGSPEDIKKAIETKAVYKKKATPFVESIDPRKPSTGDFLVTCQGNCTFAELIARLA